VRKFSNNPSPAAAQIDSPIFPGPFGCEESHFAAAFFPIVAAFAVVADPAGFAVPAAFESVVAVDPAADVEASADYLGTDLTQHPSAQHTDPLAGRKS